MPVPGCDLPHVMTPDDLMKGREVSGRVVIWDDDHFYMAGVLAELLVGQGCKVTIVTSQASVAAFAQYTLELDHIHRRLAKLGVVIVGHHAVSRIADGGVVLASVHGGPDRTIDCDGVVMVAGQAPNDTLHRELAAMPDGPRTVAFGDCLAPSIIAAAVYAGHRFARDLTLDLSAAATFLREDVAMAPRAAASGQVAAQ
jgi:dimethylamine/trimethylamine dehydrogenase